MSRKDPNLKNNNEKEMAKWYEEYYDPSWFEKCDSKEYLIRYYTRHRKKKQGKYEKWFRDADLFGNVLDLGFSSGRGLYFLTQMYDDISITAIDFNANTKKIRKYLKQVSPKIKKLRHESCSSLCDKDGVYDFCTAIDFYEHISFDIYLKSIEEVFRVLKKGGMLYIYMGKSKIPEHINLRSNRLVIKDVESKGFEFIRNNNGMLMFKKG